MAWQPGQRCQSPRARPVSCVSWPSAYCSLISVSLRRRLVRATGTSICSQLPGSHCAFHRSPSSCWSRRPRPGWPAARGPPARSPLPCACFSSFVRAARPAVGLGEHLALGRTDASGLLLPLAIDLRLLLPHVLDQLPCHRPWSRFCSVVKLLELDVQRRRPSSRPSAGRLAGRRIQDLQLPAAPIPRPSAPPAAGPGSFSGISSVPLIRPCSS